MNRLQEHGWFLTSDGLELVSNYGTINDVQKMIKYAAEYDLKEISSGEGDIHKESVILQIQKLRNISAPKNNEESKAAPRMLKMSLTDGKNSFQAVEIENIPLISLNTPPGTKFLLKGPLTVSHGIILLRASNIGYVLGGRVANLVEKWELNKKLASHTRVRPADEGGPPPWIPFGKKIVKVAEQSRSFKSLADKDKTAKENAEFEAQRKDAIAEAAKQGSKKIFGGGNKQLLDHSVQKIVDHGFTIEQAEHALKTNRNNIDRALKYLQKIDKNKSASNIREVKEPKGKRNEKKAEEISSKPSSGKISLFDFLEDKLPVQSETNEANALQPASFRNKDKEHYSQKHSKNNTFTQNTRGPRNQKISKSLYQVPPRHSEENRLNVNSNLNQFSQYSGGSSSQKTKPPRFQRNQENQNYYQQEIYTNYNKFPQVNEYKNSLGQHNQQQSQEMVLQEYTGNTYKQNREQNYQGRVGNNSKNPNFYGDSDSRNTTMSADRVYQSNTADRGYKHQSNRYCHASDISQDIGEYSNENFIKNQSFFNSNIRGQEATGQPFAWSVGDKCMAKYWEDNMYYNAQVTAVAENTCVVQFKDFNNFEEVLYADCIPIQEEISQHKRYHDMRVLDHRSNNRPPRFEQNQNFGYDSRRNASGPGFNKNSNRKRGQQRSSQPIYQPPAQRNSGYLNHNA